MFGEKKSLPLGIYRKNNAVSTLRVGESLTENQEKIIQAIIDNPKISAVKISEFVGISSRKVEENISKLKSLNVLKRVGGAKGGHWEIIG